jgi:uncharacterized protein
LHNLIVLKGKEFVTKVAITEQEQMKGLMFEKWPPPIMVFPYKNSSIRKFWMHNTISPLDIIFCNNGKIISIMKGEPLSTKLIGPDKPADFVVELPYGMAEVLTLKPGDDVSFSPTETVLASILKYR